MGWRAQRAIPGLPHAAPLDVLANPEGAAQHILSEAAEYLGGTHPQPLPQEGGEKRKNPGQRILSCCPTRATLTAR
ncbi:MAG: hypothetical protein JWL96_4535 [Sphingomonas bacterium]|nr:hypothetical protein [Sphingomonas bacterium]